MTGLPRGWARLPLSECAEFLDGQRVPVNAEERSRRPGLIPYYGATGQVGFIDAHLFDEELVLVGEDGAPFFDKTKPIAYVIRGKSWVNNHAHVLRADNLKTSNSFLKYYLDAFDFHGFVSGTTRLKLPLGQMRQIPVVIPPVAEQHRIVAEIEKQFTRLADAIHNCERALRKLERYRKLVLNAASTGQFGCSEREQSDHSGMENWTSRAATTLAPLPHGWRYLTLEGICTQGRDSMKTGPFGMALGKSDYKEHGIPIIGIENTGENQFIRGYKKFVSAEKFSLLNGYSVRPNDIIVSRSGTVGQICVIPDDVTGLMSTNLIRIRVNNQVVIPQFFALTFSGSKSTSQQISTLCSGSTRDFLNHNILRKLVFAIPPIPEQQRILDVYSRFQSLLDSFKSALENSRRRSSTLRSSVLVNAFSGQLVPQDPNDEPASVLLDRIRAERGVPGKKAVRRRHAPAQEELISQP